MAVFTRYKLFQVDDLTFADSRSDMYCTLAPSAKEIVSPTLLNYRICARSSGG